MLLSAPEERRKGRRVLRPSMGPGPRGRREGQSSLRGVLFDSRWVILHQKAPFRPFITWARAT